MLSERGYLGAFEALNNTELKKDFQNFGTVINFDKNNHPFDSDEFKNWFFIIISGKIKVYEINFETNREQTLYLMVKGDMIDVVTLLDNQPHNLAIDVLQKGKAIRFPTNKVREWMKKYPSFDHYHQFYHTLI